MHRRKYGTVIYGVHLSWQDYYLLQDNIHSRDFVYMSQDPCVKIVQVDELLYPKHDHATAFDFFTPHSPWYYAVSYLLRGRVLRNTPLSLRNLIRNNNVHNTP